METHQAASGVLEINEKGFGFLRQASNNYLPGSKDVFVARNLIQKLSLREGVDITGTSIPPQNGYGRNQSNQLSEVEQVNGLSPDRYTSAPLFNDLVSIDPTEEG